MNLARRVQTLEDRALALRPAAAPPVPLDGPADVLALLAEQVAAVREDPDVGTLERARCIGYLAGVTLKAIEAGDLAARLEAVESVLKARRAG